MPTSRTYPPTLVSSALLGHIQGRPQRVIADMLQVPRGTLRYWFEAFDKGRLALETREHSHHWVIDSPNGSESFGICKICFDKRNFKNSQEVSLRWRGSSAN